MNKTDEILNECGKAEFNMEWEKLLALSDEALKVSPDNPIALGFKSYACIKLEKYDEAREVIDRGCELYPENHYLINNRAMLNYDIGEYEKSLNDCEEGLKIREYDWLYENKLKALIKLDRISEATEFYNDEFNHFFPTLADYLVEGGKYADAIKCSLNEMDYEEIDEIKEAILKNNPSDISNIGEYYNIWIDAIKSKYDVKTCNECGGEIIPILWGYPRGYQLKMARNGELCLEGCVITVPFEYHCKNCHKEFFIGYKGLNIQCNIGLKEYVKYKINEITNKLQFGSYTFIISRKSLKNELKGFSDDEFDAFINKLIKVGYLTESENDCIGLSDFKSYENRGECLDKYAAPRWLVYPELSAGSMLWRMGFAENYAMNEPPRSEEFEKLFPMPKSWQFSYTKKSQNPYPPLGYFWTGDGKPKYPNSPEGVEVNDFITMDDDHQFSHDNFTFSSISNALAVSKKAFFEKYGVDEESWREYEYSVLLNAAYSMIMQDSYLMQQLLKTGDEALIYISSDSENLFGRALMEVRDEIKRLYRNVDKIDWVYTEYLKYQPWM